MVGAGPGGPVLSGGAALHPSGSVRCTEVVAEVVADGRSASGDDVTLSLSLSFADVSMESDEELVPC